MPNYARTGLLIGIGIARKLPGRPGLGVGFTSFQTFGAGLSLIIALHDVRRIAWQPTRMGGIHPIKSFLLPLAGVPGNALDGLSAGEISLLHRPVPGLQEVHAYILSELSESRDLYRGRISGMA